MNQNNVLRKSFDVALLPKTDVMLFLMPATTCIVFSPTIEYGYDDETKSNTYWKF